MAKPVRLAREAREEVIEAARRYGEERPELRVEFPSFASSTRAASITSSCFARASSSPAARPSTASMRRMSMTSRALARRACRDLLPRQTCPTIPPWDTGTSRACRASFIRCHIARSLRSSAIRAPASRIRLTMLWRASYGRAPSRRRESRLPVVNREVRAECLGDEHAPIPRRSWNQQKKAVGAPGRAAPVPATTAPLTSAAATRAGPSSRRPDQSASARRR